MEQGQNRQLSSRSVHVERKEFKVSVEENFQGLVVRLIEQSGRRTNMLMLPYGGAGAFMEAMAVALAEADQLLGEESDNRSE